MSLDPGTIRIVLVEPQTAENIGMTARALRNCGLSRLVLVRPVEFRTAAAYRPAMEAFPILEAAEVFDDLALSVGRSRMVIGTTRRAGQDRHPLITPAEMVQDVLPRAKGKEVSILFGTESDGLSREALDLCDILVAVPGHPDFPSFNLAQAVLLVAYEIFRTSPEFVGQESQVELATVEKREAFYQQLEQVLLHIGFLQQNNPGRVLSSLRRLYSRAGLGDRDVRILRGILSQVEWALDFKSEGKSKRPRQIEADSAPPARRPPHLRQESSN